MKAAYGALTVLVCIDCNRIYKAAIIITLKGTLSGWKAETWSCLPSYVRKNLGVATNNATCKYHVENVIDTGMPVYFICYPG